jgi:energy-coupling factor transporter ATP-binding protein EcfA2
MRDIPTVPWPLFRDAFIEEWQQGEHVAILAPTGGGKSVLGTALVKARAKRREAEVVVLGTKPKDKTLTQVGWPIVERWEDREYGQKQLILWPPYGDPETAAERQRAVFKPVLKQLFMEGSRTLYVDEIRDVERRLNLTELIEEYWFMARSNDITFVAGTQRPRWVSRSMFSEPSWLFLFRFHDIDDMRRIGEIGGETRTIERIVSKLPKYHFLCIKRDDMSLVISKVDLA